jgi:hypothetical protein
MTSTDDSTRPTGPATRRGDHLKTVRQALERWRYKMHYSRGPSSFTAAGFLPDKALTTLASNARIKTVEDMHEMIQPPWIYAPRHGQEALDLLSELDRAEKADREQAKLVKRELRKKETLERQNENKRQKILERAQSRHSKTTPQHVLDGSTTFNVVQQVSIFQSDLFVSSRQSIRILTQNQQPITPSPMEWKPSPSPMAPGPFNYLPPPPNFLPIPFSPAPFLPSYHPALVPVVYPPTPSPTPTYMTHPALYSSSTRTIPMTRESYITSISTPPHFAVSTSRRPSTSAPTHPSKPHVP